MIFRKSEKKGLGQGVSKMEEDEGVWRPLWLVVQAWVDAGGKPKEVAPVFKSGACVPYLGRYRRHTGDTQ